MKTKKKTTSKKSTTKKKVAIVKSTDIPTLTNQLVTKKEEPKLPIVLTFHSPAPSAFPNRKRATVVGVVEGDQINIGVSVCSTKDTFNKQLGRTIAIGRASKEKSRFCSLKVTNGTESKQIFYAFASKVAELV